MADYSGHFGKLFIVTYWIISYLSYMAFLAFLPVLPLLLLTYIFPYKKIVKFLSICVALLSITLLIVDISIFSTFNFHLNSIIFSMFFDIRFNEIFSLSREEIIFFIFVFLLVLLLEIKTARIIWNTINHSNYVLYLRYLGIYWLGGILFCYLILVKSISENNNLISQQTANLPLFNQISSLIIPHMKKEGLREYMESHFVQRQFSNDPMRYPLHPMICKKPTKPYNIILITVDSLRFDRVEKTFMPNITHFAEQNWQFLRHFSGGNSTQPGLFSLFYSIPSSYWSATLKQKISPILMQLLANYDYKFGIFWPVSTHNPPFDQTIFQSVPKKGYIKIASKENVGDRDKEATDHAIQFLLKSNHNQSFFMNVHYDSTHSYCSKQNFTTPNITAKKPCLRMFINNQSEDTTYFNRYLNAVHFIDLEIAKLLNVIQEQGLLENSIVIITSDHGEEFNDYHHNYWGHTSNFAEAQTHIPLIIHWPLEKPHIFSYTTTSYDLVPTLLQRLFSCQNNLVDYSIGYNLLDEEKPRYPIFVASYSYVGFIEADRLTSLFASGEISITDLKLTPKPYSKPRIKALKQALEWMRMYYPK